MVRRTGPQNLELRELISQLTSLDSKLWKRIASDLKKPTRQRRKVNLFTINKNAREGEVIVVPGKVLSLGDLDKKVNVAAWQFSQTAREKIVKSNGTAISIKELVEKDPKGKRVRILG
jgi:large subunit ribosomal protein L18e